MSWACTARPFFNHPRAYLPSSPHPLFRVTCSGALKKKKKSEISDGIVTVAMLAWSDTSWRGWKAVPLLRHQHAGPAPVGEMGLIRKQDELR
jgi:hypothetical protein